MINKNNFSTDYTLQMKYIPKEDVGTVIENLALITTVKQSVCSYDSEDSIYSIYDKIKDGNIINAVFDVSLNFGDVSEYMGVLDDDLIEAYIYTAYHKLMFDKIIPLYDKGEVYGIIHGGYVDGEIIRPYLQLIFTTHKDMDEIIQEETHEWTEEFKQYIAPLQQAIVDFMHVEYPAYVTDASRWVELNSWGNKYRIGPLAPIKESIGGN